MGRLSRKDAKVLSLLATTPELKDKLNEYIGAEKVANKLWKEFREAVVDGESEEYLGMSEDGLKEAYNLTYFEEEEE